MKRLGLLLLLVLLLSSAACGGGGGTPPSTPPPSGGGDTISGTERLGWDQQAADAGELATFRYAVYVDGNRVELQGSACGAVANGTSPCTAPLPAMSAGAHTLELASFIVNGTNVIESPKSAALRVTVRGATAGTTPTPGTPTPSTPTSTNIVTADGLHLRFDTTTDGIESATALAFAPDGRGFLAERQGRVRVVRDGVPDADAALVIGDVVMTSATEGGLLGLAIDADFARTHFVYALYTTAAPDGAPRFRLARFREAGDTLGERVILLDNVEASTTRPSAALAIGPDGKVYVAFDAADQPAAARALGSYSGKVLRLNTDGTTPDDQPSGSPVYAVGYESPRGMDWQPSTGTLWAADVKDADRDELRPTVRAALRGSAIAESSSVALPAGTAVRSLAFYRGDLLPQMRGDLLVASANGYILRLTLDAEDQTRITASERLLSDLGPVTAVAVAPNGGVYFATARQLIKLTGGR